MKYRLIIDGIEAKLSEGTTITLNKEKLDFNNLSVKRIEWSNSITLPICATNSRIFSSADKYNSVIRVLGHKQPFSLYLNNALINEGYCKLNSVDSNGFKVNLYGKLGDVLGDLIYKSDDSDEKLTLEEILPKKYKNTTVNFSAAMVRAAWYNIDNTSSVNSWFNLALTNDGYISDGFDAKRIIMPSAEMDGYNITAGNTKGTSLPFSYDKDGNIVKWEDKVYYASVISTLTPFSQGYGIMELQREVTPIEARCINTGMLRPVVNVNKIVSFIGEYLNSKAITLDFQTVIDKDLWMTLPAYNNPTAYTEPMYKFFKGTCSPGEFLIGLAKITASDIDYDITNSKLIIKPFTSGYNITKEIKMLSEPSVEVNTVNAELVFNLKENTGAKAVNYKEDTGYAYGSLAYKFSQFNDIKSKNVFSDLPFTQAVDVYPYIGKVLGIPVIQTGICNEASQWILTNNTLSDNVQMGADVSLYPTDPGSDIYVNTAWKYNGKGLFPLPLMDSTDENGKYKDGNTMQLCYFNGTKEISWDNELPSIDSYYMWLYCGSEYVSGKPWSVDDKVPYCGGGVRTAELFEYFTKYPIFCSGKYSWNVNANKEYSLYKSASFGLGANNFYTTYWRPVINTIQNTRKVKVKVYIDDIAGILNTVFEWKNNKWIVTKVSGYDYETKEATVELVEKKF